VTEHTIKLPDVGEGMTEAEIVEWHVSVGDTVAEDELLGAVMTDKAAVDIPSPVAGVVAALGGDIGDVLAVGADYVRIALDGELPDGALTAKPADPVQTEPTQSKPIESSPVALHFVSGTGPAGRISHGDLDAFLAGDHASATASSQQPADRVEEIKIVGMRRQIAEKMQQAKRRIPHFSYVEETDVTTLEELRAQLNANRNAEQPKLTVLPFVVMALVRALAEFPQMNARFDDDAQVIRRHSAVHLGIATQTDRGLMVPVVHNAQALDVWELASKISALAEAARSGRIRREDLVGATITLTSLGALGGIVTTPVINYPEVAIVGINRIVTRPVFMEERVVPRKLMNLSSSFDHRVVDGFDAAEFVQRIRSFIEFPSTIFIPG